MVSSGASPNGYAYVKLDNVAEGSYISADENPSEAATRMTAEEAIRHFETSSEYGLEEVWDFSVRPCLRCWTQSSKRKHDTLLRA